jgi:hypothetical protein
MGFGVVIGINDFVCDLCGFVFFCAGKLGLTG